MSIDAIDEARPSQNQRSIDRLCIDTIRTLSMDAVQQADSGHPGAPMGFAPLIYTLWQGFLRFDPADPTWPNRDRFVLSNGHASMMLYAMLHLAGVKEVNADDALTGEDAVTLGDTKRFREIDSKCPGHPEYHLYDSNRITIEGHTEQRGEFYEATGALRDMVPNHILTLVSMVAMEPPTGFDAASVRAKKAEMLTADFRYDDWFPKEPNVGYETLLYDVMIGDQTLFMRADMVEETWRIVQPVLDAWAAEKADFPDYASGSDGPQAADDPLARDGDRAWRPVGQPSERQR